MLAITCTLDYEPALRAVFASDPDVAAKWHVAAPCTLDDAVVHSVLALKMAGDDFFFYEVWENNVLIGYFGVEEDFNYVPTLGLVKSARTPENKQALVDFFRKFTDGYRPFAVGANKCNTPVCRFLDKLPDFRRVPLTEHHFIYFSTLPCPPSS